MNEVTIFIAHVYTKVSWIGNKCIHIEKIVEIMVSWVPREVNLNPYNDLWIQQTLFGAT